MLAVTYSNMWRLCPFAINIVSLEYFILARKDHTGTEVSDSFVKFLNTIKGVCHSHRPRTCVLQVKEAQLVSLQTPPSWRESCTTRHWKRAHRALDSPSSEATALMSSCRWKTYSVTALLPMTTRWDLVSRMSTRRNVTNVSGLLWKWVKSYNLSDHKFLIFLLL